MYGLVDPPVRAGAKCAAVGCVNRTHEGVFVGVYCYPCYLYLEGDSRNYTYADWGAKTFEELDDITMGVNV